MRNSTPNVGNEAVRKLIKESIVVLAHTDLAASDVDWRRESGERGVLDKRHAAPPRAGGGATFFGARRGGRAASAGYWTSGMRLRFALAGQLLSATTSAAIGDTATCRQPGFRLTRC